MLTDEVWLPIRWDIRKGVIKNALARINFTTEPLDAFLKQLFQDDYDEVVTLLAGRPAGPPEGAISIDSDSESSNGLAEEITQDTSTENKSPVDSPSHSQSVLKRGEAQDKGTDLEQRPAKKSKTES
jgi:hypothetical protein